MQATNFERTKIDTKMVIVLAIVIAAIAAYFAFTSISSGKSIAGMSDGNGKPVAGFSDGNGRTIAGMSDGNG